MHGLGWSCGLVFSMLTIHSDYAVAFSKIAFPPHLIYMLILACVWFKGPKETGWVLPTCKGVWFGSSLGRRHLWRQYTLKMRDAPTPPNRADVTRHQRRQRGEAAAPAALIARRNGRALAGEGAATALRCGEGAAMAMRRGAGGGMQRCSRARTHRGAARYGATAGR